MPGFKHFVFDLDGTLVDTERILLTAWQRTLQRYGYHFSLEQLRCVLGVTTQAGLQALGVRADDDFERRWQQDYRPIASQAKLFKGVPEMLDQLKRRGCALGAVSSRNRGEYAEYFSVLHMERWLDMVVLEEDTKEHKPLPEPMLCYMALTGARPRECVYIGDMPSDIACGNAAGVATGLVRWNGSDVRCDEATFVLDAPSDAVKLLDA